MGFNLIERLMIVLTTSWKAQAAALLAVCATLGTFAGVQHAANTLAQSALTSEVALNASNFHAQWLAAGLVLVAGLLGLVELCRSEWQRIYDQF